uniref:Nucleoprotein n=1 Tax=Wenling triplecross lizardfish paramyxovirus TaxID=2116451 RepID=A0A2P1GN12_9MONO|nr:nucleoprotein [Wenling triplecross lizardfish paramyxovirus]
MAAEARKARALSMLTHDDKLVGRQDAGVRVAQAGVQGDVVIPNHEKPAHNTITVLQILASIIFSGAGRTQMAARLAGILAAVTKNRTAVVGRICAFAGIAPKPYIADQMGFLGDNEAGVGIPMLRDRNVANDDLMRDLEGSFSMTVEGQATGLHVAGNSAIKPFQMLERTKRTLHADFEEDHTADDQSDATGSIVLQIILILGKAVTNPADQDKSYERRMQKFESEGHIKSAWRLTKSMMRELSSRMAANHDMRLIMVEFMCYCRDAGVSGGMICQQIANASDYVVRAGLTSFFKTVQYAASMHSIAHALPTVDADIRKLEHLMDVYTAQDNKGGFMILTSDARRNQFAPNNYPVAWSFAIGVAVAKEPSMQDYQWNRPFLDAKAFVMGQIFANNEHRFITSGTRSDLGMDDVDMQNLNDLSEMAEKIARKGNITTAQVTGLQNPTMNMGQKESTFKREEEDDSTEDDRDSEEDEEEQAERNPGEGPSSLSKNRAARGNMSTRFKRRDQGRGTVLLGGVLKNTGSITDRSSKTMKAAIHIYKDLTDLISSPGYTGRPLGDALREAISNVKTNSKPRLDDATKRAVIGGLIIPGFNTVEAFGADFDTAAQWALYTLVEAQVQSKRLNLDEPYPHIQGRKYASDLAEVLPDGKSYLDAGYRDMGDADGDLSEYVLGAI